MEKYKKIWLFIIVLSIILLMLIVVMSLLNQPKKSSVPQQNTINAPTPAKIVSNTTNNPPISNQPIHIRPTFTGANEEIPKNILDEAAQKQLLKKNTPVNTNTFTVIYDYAADVFIATIQEPKQENRVRFDQWLALNYPSIPVDKFLFK